MTISRRQFTITVLGATAALAAPRAIRAQETPDTTVQPPRNRIAVSTYSFWRFLDNSKLSIDQCIDEAARLGFDGVEILHMQMESDAPAYLQRLKQRAFVNGLDLCGFSTHQDFVSPDVDDRQRNVDDTIRCIELAYALGIPTIRVNTGRWGTTKDFDTLMANRGIEPNLEGYTDDDGFAWVIESLEKCVPVAERCGVTMGLENHWGLGRTPEGVLRIIQAVDSPWLQATLDTGNFLEDPYDRLELDGAERRAGSGQDVLRRRHLVFARAGLRAHRRALAPPQLPRLRLAGIRRQRRLAHRHSKKLGTPARSLRLSATARLGVGGHADSTASTAQHCLIPSTAASAAPRHNPCAPENRRRHPRHSP